MSITFEFYRYRFHLRALDAVHFPPGKTANVVRGAFGSVLRDAVPPAVYARLFEPDASLGPAPSGLADWPRPFVLRVAHLDALTIPAGEPFFLDAHIFDVHQPVWEHFHSAFVLFGERGLGPGRGRAQLERIEQLDLEDGAREVRGAADPPIALRLETTEVASEVTVRFHTPTELKSEGSLTERPDFHILFRRMRDRISTLRALYGAGPLDLDFRGMGERAAAIRMTRCDLNWEHIKRRSGRTGQVHPIGGFTGEAEYRGALGEFLPWLRAARWVGVGRQTVWGKGDVRVVEPAMQSKQ
jgi:CRISPR-associated endoribonuclease Cas6